VNCGLRWRRVPRPLPLPGGIRSFGKWRIDEKHTVCAAAVRLRETAFAQGARRRRRRPALRHGVLLRRNGGHQQEFLQLFLKNHYPLLQKNVESGRILSVKIEQPANHMTEDARWDFRVTIRFKTRRWRPRPIRRRGLIKQLWPNRTGTRPRNTPVRDSAGPLGSSGDGYHPAKNSPSNKPPGALECAGKPRKRPAPQQMSTNASKAIFVRFNQ